MRRRLLRLKVWPALYAILAAFGVVQLSKPEPALGSASELAADTHVPVAGPFFAADLPARRAWRPSVSAFGRSGELKLLSALPGGTVEFPLELGGDASGVSYE